MVSEPYDCQLTANSQSIETPIFTELQNRLDRYAKKVTGKEEGDFCKKEFKYACMRKKPFVPVVMEERMRDATSWPGTIGMNLGSKKYESLVEDEDFDQKCEALLQNVLKQLG
jgi:hypothetical protein